MRTGIVDERGEREEEEKHIHTRVACLTGYMVFINSGAWLGLGWLGMGWGSGRLGHLGLLGPLGVTWATYRVEAGGGGGLGETAGTTHHQGEPIYLPTGSTMALSTMSKGLAHDAIAQNWVKLSHIYRGWVNKL